jgi:valyl-tRNA synthetase
MTAWVRDEILKLMHPFMPFVTEELWSVTAAGGPVRDTLLALTRWPELAALDDEAAAAEIGWVIDLVAAIRSVKAEMNIMATEIPLVLAGVSSVTQTRAERWADVIKRLARLSSLAIAASPPPGSVQLVVRGEVAALPLKGVVDFVAERLRLEKELARIAAEITRIDGKLANADFIRRAPEEVVEGERERREEAQARRAKIVEALERLKNADLG